MAAARTAVHAKAREDLDAPKQIAAVQTCRGSHTHTLVTDPKDKANVSVYVPGTGGVRSPNELAGCVRSPDDTSTALFRIEVIKVPLASPPVPARATALCSIFRIRLIQSASRRSSIEVIDPNFA